jgi:Tol biopolymer transport system component
VSVTAPPRPPRPGDPVDREELEALVEALIEEARRRARRRRLVYWAAATAAALVGVTIFVVLERTARSQPGAGLAPRAGGAASGVNSRIAFMSSPRSLPGLRTDELHVVNADGSGNRLVARVLTSQGNGHAVWAPDGTHLFFEGGRDPTPVVYLVNVDGTGLRNVSRAWGLDGIPVWAPDGKRFAFSNKHGIHVMNADGRQKRRLTPKGDALTWSPDGRKIAFTRFIRPSFQGSKTWVISADGTQQRLLTDGGGPVWSPDGRKIAFTSTRDGNPELYVMNVDGTAQRRLTWDAAGDQQPAWSPDGRTIAFERAGKGQASIYVVSPDGSGLRRLTERGGGPVWSPDGKQISFRSVRDGDFEVYLMNANGSEQRNLSQNPLGDEQLPAWSPGQMK